jgi:hypothetical protein
VTRYRVPIAAELLNKRPWRHVEGWRLISVDGPWLAHPGVSICTAEDDDAPPELEGAFVEPVLRHEGDGTVRVIDRIQLSDSGLPIWGE